VLKFRSPAFKIPTRFTLFPNGELKTEILESIRGRDVYIFQDVENHQSLSFNDGKNTKVLSVNDHLMNLFVAVDAAKQAGAQQVTLVIPVYPYSRQHKKKGREGLTASRIGKMLESMGVDRIITLDIHSHEIENCFKNLRLENLHAYFPNNRKAHFYNRYTKRGPCCARAGHRCGGQEPLLRKCIATPLALLYKERDYSRVSRNASDSNIREMRLLGSVKDKTVFMADDMLGTGGTLLKAMKFLREQGAKNVICAISLPFFSGNAVEHFEEAYKQGLFYRIIGTNAVYHEALLKTGVVRQREYFRPFRPNNFPLAPWSILKFPVGHRDIIEKLLAKT